MAATTVNLLGLNEALSAKDSLGDFQNTGGYISGWAINSGNASYTIVDTETHSLTPTYYAMNVAPTNNNPVVIELTNQSVVSSQAFNCNLAFSGNLLSTQSVTTKTEICQQTESFGSVSIPNPDPTSGNLYTILVDGYPLYSSSRETQNIPGQWTAFRSNYYPLVENRAADSSSNYNMKIRITVGSVQVLTLS